MPTFDPNPRTDQTSFLYDRSGKLLSTLHGVENRIHVNLEEIPLDVQNAIIAMEDHSFRSHVGIDIIGIGRAVVTDLIKRRYSQGASTITQQLVRTVFLSQDKSMRRKIQEAILALRIERMYTKDDILEMYLNQTFWGHDAYGIQAACRLYFGHNIQDLAKVPRAERLAKAATLAGVLGAPNVYSPFVNSDKTKRMRNGALRRMAEQGYISQAEQKEAESLPLMVQPSKQNSTASYFTDWIAQQLVERYGADAVFRGGLRVYTTLDLDMQRAAESTVASIDKTPRDANGLYQPQAALVSLDPHTGAVRAMVGGRNNDKFNRAVQAYRQPGSAMKPFVYVTAIDNGKSPSTIYQDTPTQFPGAPPDWPKNYDRKFAGPMTMRQALEQSKNVVAVKICQEVGVNKVLSYAQRMGISSLVPDGPQSDANLAMALGGLSKGASVLDMASAYGVLANMGVRHSPFAITKVLDQNGAVLEQHEDHPIPVLPASTAYVVTDMLKGVIAHGTGRAADIGRTAVAGKTGTTSDYKDAWFVGYTPDLVTAVWLGGDRPAKDSDYMTANHITGGSYPARLWSQFMKTATKNMPDNDWTVPEDVVKVDVDTKSGNRPGKNTPTKNVKQEIFVEGQEPPANEGISTAVRLKICPETGLLATDYCPSPIWRVFLKNAPGSTQQDQPPTRSCTKHTAKPVTTPTSPTTADPVIDDSDTDLPGDPANPPASTGDVSTTEPVVDPPATN